MKKREGTQSMKRKSIALLLAMVMCLGLSVPAFAVETIDTKTIGGITITANRASDYDQYEATLTFAGSGTLTENILESGAEILYTRGIADILVNIGPGISAPDESKLIEFFSSSHLRVVKVNFGSESTPQTFGGFTDVKESDYFADAVLWAVGKKITSGTSATTFSPSTNCTVAQILTFLWRANGAHTSNTWKNPFSDVKSSDYYYNAALWAYEKGMVTGGTFGGDRPCTRSMAVTYMWKAADSPSTVFDIINHGVTLRGYHGSDGDVVIPDGVEEILEETFENCKNLNSVAIPSSVTAIDWNVFEDCNSLTDVYYEGSEAQWKAISIAPDNNALSKAAIHYNSKMPEQKPVITGFTDVPATADYAEAVKWAVDKGVTSGTSAATFSPDSVCTRGQIVTFMYRGLAK